jgi:tetratricopeptide (TPR) repeat protein
LAADAQHAGLLYQLGILRYEQGRLDDAIAALSQSLKNDSRRADVYNYLGFVLGKKGLVPESESAFRKALQLDPTLASAHANLAWVYAHQRPPSPALAQWHYQKAIAGGAAPNPELEAKLKSLTAQP